MPKGTGQVSMLGKCTCCMDINYQAWWCSTCTWSKRPFGSEIRCLHIQICFMLDNHLPILLADSLTWNTSYSTMSLGYPKLHISPSSCKKVSSQYYFSEVMSWTVWGRGLLYVSGRSRDKPPPIIVSTPNRTRGSWGMDFACKKQDFHKIKNNFIKLYQTIHCIQNTKRKSKLS